MSSRRDGHFAIALVIVLAAFAIGSGIGISMGFSGNDINDFKEVIHEDNNTTPTVDVTHNISAYENKFNASEIDYSSVNDSNSTNNKTSAIYKNSGEVYVTNQNNTTEDYK